MKKFSKTKIATTYANALYLAALEKNSLEKVFDDVQKLLPAIRKNADFIMYMANPLLDDISKKEMLKAISQKIGLDKETLHCLEVVLENRRFAELSLILEAFKHLYYQKKNIVEVEVDCVKPLSTSQDKKLKSNLEKSLGKKIVVSYTITPEILGGLRVKFGSNMIDDTLVNKLNRLEIMMKGDR